MMKQNKPSINVDSYVIKGVIAIHWLDNYSIHLEVLSSYWINIQQLEKNKRSSFLLETKIEIDRTLIDLSFEV